MEEKSAGIQRSRRVRYDGGREDRLLAGPPGSAGTPQPVLETYGLCPGDSLAVGRICPQSVELVPGRPGEAAISPSGLLRLPLGVWPADRYGAGGFLADAVSIPPDPVSGGPGTGIKKGRPPWAALALFRFSSSCLLYEFFQRRAVNALSVVSQKLQQLGGDQQVSSGSVALQVDGKNGVVDRQPQQEPALALPLGEGNPNALPVVWGDGPAWSLA